MFGQHSTKPDEIDPSNTFNNFQTNPFDDIKIRTAFVRKVFSILSVQLLATFGIVLIFTFVEPIKSYTRNHIWFYITSYIVFLVFYLILICVKSVARKFPLNFIFLGILTLTMGIMLGNVAAYHNTYTVILAMSTTVAVSFGMTLLSLQTKYDLTKKLYGPLFAALICLIMFGIFAIIFRSSILTAVYGFIGALIFSLFIAVDVQLIVGGRTIQISEEDYIFGALALYMDIVNLFIMLLTFIGAVNN
ncbi:hypothetical protein GJ496_006725 [Pomphorhynchus laevis]|nr:hypothetical protein GJ496_006725 [Pomphorhynchus laevis]